jgi:hypothetical protein
MIPNWPQINQSLAMRRDDVCIYEGPPNRARLEAIIADRYSPSKAVWRAEIVLATADELGTNAIMTPTGKSKPRVRQERYVEEGVDGFLRDKARPPVRKPLSPAIKRTLLAKTGSETLTDATRWMTRSTAAAVGISHRNVQRIWAEASLKPHHAHRFKTCNDPKFDEKANNVVGLSINPQDRDVDHAPDPGARPHPPGPAPEEGSSGGHSFCVDQNRRLSARQRTQALDRLDVIKDAHQALESERYDHMEH